MWINNYLYDFINFHFSNMSYSWFIVHLFLMSTSLLYFFINCFQFLCLDLVLYSLMLLFWCSMDFIFFYFVYYKVAKKASIFRYLLSYLQVLIVSFLSMSLLNSLVHIISLSHLLILYFVLESSDINEVIGLLIKCLSALQKRLKLN